MVLFFWRLPSGPAELCPAELCAPWLWPACPLLTQASRGLAGLPRHGGHPGVHTVLPAGEMPALGVLTDPQMRAPGAVGSMPRRLGLVVRGPHRHAWVNIGLVVGIPGQVTFQSLALRGCGSAWWAAGNSATWLVKLLSQFCL